MTIADEFLQLMEKIGKTCKLPAVREIHIASGDGSPDKSSKFGALVLDDDTVGLTYVGLGDTLRALQNRPEIDDWVGHSPVEVAQLYGKKEDWQRCLGMAAINAISQFVFRNSDYQFTDAGGTMDLLNLKKSDRVGMVGFFPPLVEKIRGLGVPLTVIELDPKWLQQEYDFEVTLDSSRLQGCNKILMTGTILINQTIDDLLVHTAGAEEISIVGPTVGCLPDPLFRRGVTVIGGLEVLDNDRFLTLWRAQAHWRETTRRYTLDQDNYQGFESLLWTDNPGVVK